MDEQIASTEEIIDRAMQKAIEAAYKGAPFVSPNPLVGCAVINSQGKIISVGYHKKYGGPHAEVEALASLSDEQLQGATVVVTLEPCAHEGKTPSCAKMLIRKPIAKVIYGLVDPNPLVAGQGAEIIRQAGIACEEYQPLDNHPMSLEIKNELEQVCEVFLKNFREKKIFVAAKIATTLDGFVADKNGKSKWITGEDSRQYVHWLRACYDAIAVGAETVLADNPRLNIRFDSINKKNFVVIFDRQLRSVDFLKTSEILKHHSSENIFIVCLPEQCSDIRLKEMRVQVIAASSLAEAYQKLYEKGIRSVLCETGGGLFEAHLQENCLNRLYLFQSNQLLGQGQHWRKQAVNGQDLGLALRLKHQKFKFFQQDLLISSKL